MTELILILHVLGAGLIIGIIFFSVILTFRPHLPPEKLSMLRWIGRFGMAASIWQLLTGIYLTSTEWSEFRDSRLFWVKMGLYVLEGIIAGLLIERRVKHASQENTGRGFGLTFLLWSVIILGIVIIGVLLVEGQR